MPSPSASALIDRRSFAIHLGALTAATAAGAKVGAAPRSPDTSARRIARFVTSLRLEDVPANVIEKAKEQIIFFFGRAFEGHGSTDAAQMRAALAPYWQTDGATVIGERLRMPPAEAAFANCTLMRGEQGKDDVIWPAGIHAGVITLPSALAVAETRNSSGAEFLLSMILGYEVLGKLGDVADPWTIALPRRPTTVYGGFGPTAVTSRLLGLDLERTAAAIGYGADLGMGFAEGGMMPHFYSFLNSAGVRAASLAAAGAAPYSATVIEGEAGLFRSTFGEVPASLDTQLDKLGSDWEILKAEQKHFPGTGQNAVAIEILLDLRKRERLEPAQVVSIHVVLPNARDSVIRKNELSSRGPFRRQVSAYSSLPFALALVLLEGDVKDSWYADNLPLESLNNATIAREMRKITVAFEDRAQTPRYCRLSVELKSGRRFTREIVTYTPTLRREAWREWLARSAANRLPLERLTFVEDAIKELERLPSLTELMRAVRPTP